MKNKQVRTNPPQESDLAKLPHKLQVRFACYCARQVLDLVEEQHRPIAIKAIEVAEAWVLGEATEAECEAAAYAAYVAYAAANAANAAAYAAYAAASAAYAAHATANAAANAAYAAYAAASAAANAAYATDAPPSKDRQSLVEAQWEYYNDLMSIDESFERMALSS